MASTRHFTDEKFSESYLLNVHTRFYCMIAFTVHTVYSQVYSCILLGMIFIVYDCGFVVASSTSALCRWINCGTVAIIFNGTLSGLTSASRLFCFCSKSLVLLVGLQCNNWNLQRYLPVLLKASYTPLVVDFEAVLCCVQRL